MKRRINEIQNEKKKKRKKERERRKEGMNEHTVVSSTIMEVKTGGMLESGPPPMNPSNLALSNEASWNLSYYTLIIITMCGELLWK